MDGSQSPWGDSQAEVAQNLRNTVSNDAAYAEATLAGTQTLISDIRNVFERDGVNLDLLDMFVGLSVSQALIEARIRNMRSNLGELDDH